MTEPLRDDEPTPPIGPENLLIGATGSRIAVGAMGPYVRMDFQTMTERDVIEVHEAGHPEGELERRLTPHPPLFFHTGSIPDVVEQLTAAHNMIVVAEAEKQARQAAVDAQMRQRLN